MATLITAFDLTPDDCKVVQLVRQKTIQVRRALVIPFPPSEEEGEKAVAVKAHVVREALRAHKLQPLNPVLVVPKHSATVRSVFLPSVEPNEIEGMARFEAEKIIPFNVERHVISHTVLTQESIGGSRVLLAAVDEPIISESLHVLTQAGVDPTASQVSSLALADAWRRDNPSPPEGVTALVNIGSVHTDITLLNKGVLLTARSALHGTSSLLTQLGETLNSPRPLTLLDLLRLDAREPGLYTVPPVPPVSPSIAGGLPAGPAASAPALPPEGGATSEPVPDGVPSLPIDPPTPGRDPAPFEIVPSSDDPDATTGPVADIVRQWIGRLLTEIRRTFEFARREFDIGNMDFIRLSGEGALIQGLEQNLTVTLGAEVSVFSPLSEVSVAPKQPEIDPAILPVFAIATGGALHGLWPGAYLINLLPSEIVERQESQARRLALMLLGAMALIALTVTYLYFSGLYNWRQERLSRYERYNARMETEVKELKEKKRKIAILEEYQRDRAYSLGILNAISAYPKIGPANKNGRLTITNFVYTSGDEVKIEGHSLDIPDIFDFVSYLEKIEIDGKRAFRHVQVRSHSPKDLSGRPNVYAYQLICYLQETRIQLATP